MARWHVTRRLVGAFMLIQLNEPRSGSAARIAAAAAAAPSSNNTSTTVQALAAQTGLIQIALIWPRWDQQALRRLGRLEVPADRRARRRGVRGTAASTAAAILALNSGDD